MLFGEEYLTYDEYRLMGGTLDRMPFSLLEFESRRRIDKRTQNRLKDVETKDIPQEVKLCINKLINVISEYNNTSKTVSETGNIASENTDGYSVSYVNASQVGDLFSSKEDEITKIIREYLGGVIFNGEHLLFAGVSR